MTTYARRSWLFAPGNDARKCAKALAAGADCVILDLEDAVALGVKAAAREQVRALLSACDAASPRAYVRVNDVASGLLEADVAAIAVDGLAGVVLPKAERPEQVVELDRLIAEAEHASGRQTGTAEIVALVETAAGLLAAPDIARASPRLVQLAFGAADLCADLGIPTANDGPHILNAKVRTIWASRAAGLLPPVDTVYFDLADPAGLEADAAAAKALGFGGKLVIHPAQVEPVNRLLAPSDAEIAEAARIVEAFRKAEAAGTGAISVDGKLIDYAMIKSAERTLAVARSLGRRP